MNIFVRVGPKGQVVIPKIFREAFGIAPGTEVILEEKVGEGLVIKKPATDFVDVFERIARAGKSVKIRPHAAYDEELEERTGSA